LKRSEKFKAKNAKKCEKTKKNVKNSEKKGKKAKKKEKIDLNFASLRSENYLSEAKRKI
jgi:hypothetical protein